MKTVLEFLRYWRGELWKALTANDRTTWIAHFLLVSIGTFPPAAVVSWLAGMLAGVLAAVWISEGWLLFMAGREVVDFLRGLASGKPAARIRRDGIGDLVGPVLVHGFAWAALVAVLLEG